MFTIYALFGDDFRVIATAKSADPVFNILTIIVLSGFLLEIVLASIANEEYFLSLYFWLDCLSTVTMVMDITWIWDQATNDENDAIDDAQSASNFFRASRGARIGARLSRLSRVMRFIRLLRVVRLYKKANSEFNKMNDDNEFKRIILRHRSH